MHDHSDNSRVSAPAGDLSSDRVEYGRQLAMDRIVLDECRGMMATTGEARHGSVGARRGLRRRFLWVGAGIAASILGVWAILWGTGALQSGMAASSTNTGSVDLAHRESPSDLVSTPPRKGGSPVASNPDVPARSAKKENATKRQAPWTDPGSKIASVVPGPGVKLKKLEIPQRNARGEIPIPAGADPEDIRTIRSAVKMFEAEEKLARMVKAGLIKGIDGILSFEEISSWTYEDGLKGMPAELDKLDGKKVLMTGFMLPIDVVENIKEFLLVESLWSCCYGQPPDINGVVRVILQGGKRTDYEFDPIKLVGTFRIQPTIEDGFCVDVFQLEVERVEVIK